MLKDWHGAYNSGMKKHLQRFSGIERLYGKGSLQRLGQCHVAVIGIGGVGSWLVEALARSGVGQLTLFDADDICLSNTNRQMHALDGHYGQNKVDAMKARCLAINPDMQVNAVASFITPSNMAEWLEPGFDLVIDGSGANAMWFVPLLRQDALDMLELGMGKALDADSIQESIGYDLSVNDVEPKLFLPGLAGLTQGPGFPNLSCLGRLSDRVLGSQFFTKTDAAARRVDEQQPVR